MEECAWREDEGVWETDCGETFVLNDGTPYENGMRFCCFCGKGIAQFPEGEEKC